MTSVSIGTILAKLRKNRRLTPADVSTMLRAKHSIALSPNAILNYEKDIFLPDTTIFLALCNIYSCHDILSAFDCTDIASTAVPLKSEEKEIIIQYRKLPLFEKNMILGALDIKKDSLWHRILSLVEMKIFLLWISHNGRTLGHNVLKCYL